MHTARKRMPLQHLLQHGKLVPRKRFGATEQRIKISCHGGSPFDPNAAVLLFYRIGGMHPVAEQLFLQQQRESPPIRQGAQQKLEVVRVTQRREKPYPFQQRPAKDQVRGAHDEIAVDQCDCQIAFLLVEIQCGRRTIRWLLVLPFRQ